MRQNWPEDLRHKRSSLTWEKYRSVLFLLRPSLPLISLPPFAFYSSPSVPPLLHYWIPMAWFMGLGNCPAPQKIIFRLKIVSSSFPFSVPLPIREHEFLLSQPLLPFTQQWHSSLVSLKTSISSKYPSSRRFKQSKYSKISFLNFSFNNTNKFFWIESGNF